MSGRRLRLLVAASLLTGGAQPVCASEENARITGTAAGPSCSLVAVGIVRQSLRYPLLQFSGWSRGIPTVTKNVAELWLLDRALNELRLALSVPSPRRWTDATRYTIAPRVLPDGTVVYTLRGCPAEAPNCTESSSYTLGAKGKPAALPEYPAVSADESAQIRACTTYITSTNDNQPQVSIGPTGGPWRPVLDFKDRRLTRLESR